MSNHYLIISYCTKGPYEKEAEKLRESLDKLKLPYHIQIIDSLGSWQKNCLYKPIFIKQMLAEHKKPVLYLDADAVVRRIPLWEEFNNVDFAVHYFRGEQLASGTLFFNNTLAALNLLDAWIEQNKIKPQELDQANLQETVERPGWKNRIKIRYLPAEYCKIFDLTKNVDNPIIEHFQSSRRLKWTR